MTSAPDQEGTPHAPSPGAPWRLVAALLVVLVVVAVWRPARVSDAQEAPSADASAEVVALTIRRPDADERELEVAWREGSTVEAVTRASGVPSRWRGEGEMAFLESLDGTPNEGADGLNWQFEVNGVYAARGAGATTLAPGDRVLWKLAPYE